MTSIIYDSMQRLSQLAYSLAGYSDSYEIKASPENLKTAIQAKGTEVLKYQFKDASQTYSPLEYAVKIEDIESACTLIGFGAKVENSNICGTVVHFYMDCIREDVAPNLEMLNLLLDHISDVNIEEESSSRTALQYVLDHVKHYKTIHWSVIAILFQKGIKVTGKTKFTRSPFTILKDAHYRKIQNGKMVRSPAEERIFLTHLQDYLTLERLYCPDSESTLTLEEFKFHTSSFRIAISDAVASIKNFQLDLDDGESSREPIKLQKLKMQLEDHWSQVQGIVKELSDYHKLFQKLVKEGKFTDCFERRELSSIISTLTTHDPTSDHTRKMTNLLRNGV